MDTRLTGLSSSLEKDRNIQISSNNNQTNTSGKSHAVNSNVMNMTAGQSIRGKVIEVSGRDVTISLGNDASISAHLENDLDIKSGQMMTFEVKSNTGGKLFLSPLFSNLATNTTILDALGAANLPTTQNNLSMVSTMMKEGMSIDKESLWNMQKIVNSNPQYEPALSVQLVKLGLEVTETNLEQLQQYMNFENKVTDSILDIADGLVEEYQAFQATGNEEAAGNLLKEIGKAFGVDFMKELSTLNDETIQTNLPIEMPEDTIKEFQNAILKAVTDQSTKNPFISTKAMDAQKSIVTDLAIKITNEMDQLLSKATDDVKIVPEDAINKFEDTVKEYIQNEKLPQSVKETILQLTEQLKDNVIASTLKQSTVPDLPSAQKVLGSLKELLSREWTVKPEEMVDAKAIKDLYSKLHNETEALTRHLGEIVREEAPVAKSIQNLQNNVEFMNQMNQMFSYVQIPLYGREKNAHGELYVYTNRKAMLSKDGSVSALLHLEMDNLGTMDVYVAMQNQKVNTKFYLADDSVIDFLADHISILNERLQKRGYDMQSEMVLKEKESNMMEEILDDHRNISVIATNSFDVRA